MPDVDGKSAGFIGYNARVSRSTAGSTGPWTPVPEVKSFDPAEVVVDEAEFTHLESPDKTKEFKATFKDGGTMAVVCNLLDPVLDAAGAVIQDAIVSDNGVQDANFYFKIEWRDDADTVRKTVIFPGYITGAKPPNTTITDPVDFNFSIRVTGAAVWS
ncbi:hypothetical protein LCGC14_2863670 [marine sediment metagenome]|uniref:Uncharacterized protein n=1 Tax=marine sediment metagenome TaxID=412755 RepID=A0A0F8YRQ4_9ZZZZ